MEKTITNRPLSSSDKPKHLIWDCGSSLYDSFELKSFEKQLDAAITSRTLSMPHLSDRRRFSPPPPPSNKKSPSKISRSLHRLIRSVFKPKSNIEFGENHSGEGIYVVCDSFSTVPEVPEFDGLSPEIRSLVRKTTSDRSTEIDSIGVC
ncbi:hypothetical protein OROGR_012945 [Orobanche gracilis]